MVPSLQLGPGLLARCEGAVCGENAACKKAAPKKQQCLGLKEGALSWFWKTREQHVRLGAQGREGCTWW